MSKIQEIAAAIESGKTKLIENLVKDALEGGCSPDDILNAGMIGAMSTVGVKFQKGDIFVPEMLVAARTMKEGIKVLKPHLGAGATTAGGKVVIGTVAGDLHDIGKNLVAMMIESAGFEVVDLGVDVPADKFVEAAGDDSVKIVAVSALLTTTMSAMKATCAALNGAKSRSRFKVLVGGAPITAEFAKECSADSYALDAASAAQKVKELAV